MIGEGAKTNRQSFTRRKQNNKCLKLTCIFLSKLQLQSTSKSTDPYNLLIVLGIHVCDGNGGFACFKTNNIFTLPVRAPKKGEATRRRSEVETLYFDTCIHMYKYFNAFLFLFHSTIVNILWTKITHFAYLIIMCHLIYHPEHIWHLQLLLRDSGHSPNGTWIQNQLQGRTFPVLNDLLQILLY